MKNHNNAYNHIYIPSAPKPAEILGWISIHRVFAQQWKYLVFVGETSCFPLYLLSWLHLKVLMWYICFMYEKYHKETEKLWSHDGICTLMGSYHQYSKMKILHNLGTSLVVCMCATPEAIPSWLLFLSGGCCNSVRILNWISCSGKVWKKRIVYCKHAL